MAPARATLGVILPDDGPFDYEWLHLEGWLADHGLAHIGFRLQRSEADGVMAKSSLHAIGHLDCLLPPARRLAADKVSAIAWACTSGSFVGGLGFAQDPAAGLTAETGVPATSTSLALAAAAKSLAPEEVEVLSAYSEEVSEIFFEFLRASGLTVGHTKSLDCLHTADSFEIDIAREIAAFVRDRPAQGPPILLPDTAINTLDRLDQFETLAGRPVITANLATLWQGLRLLGEPAAAGDVVAFHGWLRAGESR